MINDRVNHPKHYNVGNIEVIDYIGDRMLTFSMGNVIKYIARCNYKGNKLEDLQKAKFYLQYCIDKEIECTMCDVEDCDFSSDEFSTGLKLSTNLSYALAYIDDALNFGMRCDTDKVEIFLTHALACLGDEIQMVLQAEGE